jgi:MFS family permease
MAPRVPNGVAAAMAALRFDRAEGITEMPELDFCDRNQLTLVLGAALGDALPEWARERIARNLADNTRRLDGIRALQSQVGEWLAAAGIDFVFLKGTTQWPHFVSDPRLRVLYDLDLLCPAEDVRRAWELLLEKGYDPLPGPALPTDHLPTLIRKTGWRWRGDYFDSDSPLSIELHFRLWDEGTERLRAPGLDDFWARRSGRALDTADALGYACLHLLRHLLRGSVRPYHVYEVAWFLEHHADDREFWSRWQGLHAPELRRLEGVSFRLAQEWFGCRLGTSAREETERLPEAVREWFDVFGASPLEGLFRPNKDELWLHLALLDSLGDKAAVVRRKLLPMQLPGPVDDSVLLPEEQITWALRVGKYTGYARFLAGRAVHHVRSLGALAGSGVRWRLLSSGMSAGYWKFLGASSLFNLGMFIYVLLYNLYLFDLGFREDFVGKVSSAATGGVVVGVLPAAVLARRWGLGKLLTGCFAALCLISVMRALVTGRAPLLGFAFLNGVAFSVIAVSLAPAIARLTSEKARPAGFSISTASSIALGIMGGWLGGHMPGWLGGNRAAMLAASALVGLAVWPAARLRIGPAPAEGAKLYPRSRFVTRFLIVFAIWNLATGSFNPFFNTYFAGHLHTSVEHIGLIFSGSQLAQVAAILLAPLVLRGLGIVTGTAAMLLATAVALAGLAAGPAGWAAAGVYAAYMAFQVMSDPGMNTLLMDRVRVQEQSGASALMMLVGFSAQLAASFAGGASIARFGYPAVLACAAGLAAVAALAFRWLPAAGVRTPQPTALLQASAADTAPD